MLYWYCLVSSEVNKILIDTKAPMLSFSIEEKQENKRAITTKQSIEGSAKTQVESNIQEFSMSASAKLDM